MQGRIDDAGWRRPEVSVWTELRPPTRRPDLPVWVWRVIVAAQARIHRA